MRRSSIDRIIDESREVCARHGYELPPFAAWTPRELSGRPEALATMRAGFLGWNVVEFAPGAFEKEGIVVFTSRMGDLARLPTGGGRLYGEKAIVARDRQRTPFHYHVVKTEDILNRGGARFVVELVAVDRDGRPTGETVTALKDLEHIRVPPNGRVVLEPGESLVLDPYVAHAFWAEGGTALAGEISLVNDDTTDNYFLPPLGPFDPVEEDTPARYVTVRDLPSIGVRA
jgi:D-lyxose ketol-isomerase